MKRLLYLICISAGISVIVWYRYVLRFVLEMFLFRSSNSFLLMLPFTISGLIFVFSIISIIYGAVKLNRSSKKQNMSFTQMNKRQYLGRILVRIGLFIAVFGLIYALAPGCRFKEYLCGLERVSLYYTIFIPFSIGFVIGGCLIYKSANRNLS